MRRHHCISADAVTKRRSRYLLVNLIPGARILVGVILTFDLERRLKLIGIAMWEGGEGMISQGYSRHF